MKTLIFFLFLTLTSFSQGLVSVGSSTYLVTNNQLILDNMDVTIDGSLGANGVVKFINGNFTMNGNFDSGTSEFIFSNTTTHDHYLTTTSSSNNTFYDLSVIGDITTQYDLHLVGDITINNHLTIESQKINLNNYGITFGSNGHLFYEGDGQFLYDSDPSVGSGYIQITTNIPANTTVNPGNLGLEITTHNNQMGSTTIRRYHRMADVGGNLYGSHRIFDVTPTYNGTNYGGNLNVDLKFQYFSDMLGSVGDVSSLKLYRSGDGGQTWENKGGSVDITNGIVSVNGFNQFSQVTIAPDNGALPITLLSFTGYKNGKSNKLNWSTASENNTSYFDIQGSLDGYNWRSVGTKLAMGNSTELVKYDFDDYTYGGLDCYYQLLQYDFDGKYDTYGPIFISGETSKMIIGYTNLLGQKIIPNEAFGVIVVMYDDGSTNKIIR